MHDDARGVGRLAEALEWPDHDIQLVAARALTRLLPRLQATDAGLLDFGRNAPISIANSGPINRAARSTSNSPHPEGAPAGRRRGCAVCAAACQ